MCHVTVPHKRVDTWTVIFIKWLAYQIQLSPVACPETEWWSTAMKYCFTAAGSCRCCVLAPCLSWSFHLRLGGQGFIRGLAAKAEKKKRAISQDKLVSFLYFSELSVIPFFCTYCMTACFIISCLFKFSNQFYTN